MIFFCPIPAKKGKRTRDVHAYIFKKLSRKFKKKKNTQKIIYKYKKILDENSVMNIRQIREYHL